MGKVKCHGVGPLKPHNAYGMCIHYILVKAQQQNILTGGGVGAEGAENTNYPKGYKTWNTFCASLCACRSDFSTVFKA